MHSFRLVLAPTLLMLGSAAIVVLATFVPGVAQDRTGERIASLEGRVTMLEATVAALAGESNATESAEINPVKTIHGMIVLEGEDGHIWISHGTPSCNGIKVYSGIGGGGLGDTGTVFVENQFGDTIAKTSVSEGLVTERGCEMNVEVPVPAAETYYIKIPGQIDFVEIQSNELSGDDPEVTFTIPAP